MSMTKADVIQHFGRGKGITTRKLAKELGYNGHATIVMWPNSGPLAAESRDRVLVVMLSRGDAIPKKWIPKFEREVNT